MGRIGHIGNGVECNGPGERRPQLYIHDAWTEYAVKPGKLHLGAGIHYWNGVSRLSSHSTLTFMTLDAPISTGMWNHRSVCTSVGYLCQGQLGKLDYRVHINKPLPSGVSSSTITSPIASNILNEHWVQAVTWTICSGIKRVMCCLISPEPISAIKGFQHRGRMGTRIKAQRPVVNPLPIPYRNITRVTWRGCVPGYADQQSKGTALSVYSVFMWMITARTISATLVSWTCMLCKPVAANPGVELGGGNLQPTIGSGQIWYTQVGYLLPRLKNGTGFMPLCNIYV